jgi:hypothetical protein
MQVNIKCTHEQEIWSHSIESRLTLKIYFEFNSKVERMQDWKNAPRATISIE